MENDVKYIEYPVVTVEDFHNGEKMLIVHSHINLVGKMMLTKDEALLLIGELYKFVKK